MNQLQDGIQISYDAKRTRNRLAQRRRREKQKLQNATERQPTPPPQPVTDGTLRPQSSTTEAHAWTPLGEILQFTPPPSLNSWCPASEPVAPSPWMDAAFAAPSQDEEHTDTFLLNDEAMFQPGASLLLDPLLRPLNPTPPSPRQSSNSGQITDLRRATYPFPDGSRTQDQGQQNKQLVRGGGGAHLRRHSMGSPSISSIGATKPSSSSAAVPALADSTSKQSRPVNAAAEESIAKILVLAEELGFETFDDLAATYYTAPFSQGSLPRYAQSASRSRRLRRLLMELHASSREWVGREARGYNEGQMELLEAVCVEELNGICAGAGRAAQSQRPMHRTQTFITNMIKQLFTHDGAEQLLEKDKQLLREQVCPSAAAHAGRGRVGECRELTRKLRTDTLIVVAAVASSAKDEFRGGGPIAGDLRVRLSASGAAVRHGDA